MNEISEHKKLPFLISFFVFILSCFILYLSLSYFYVKDEKLKLKVILANLEQIMTKELKLAVSGEAKKLFLFSNYQKNYQVNSKALVTVTKENTLIIDNQNFQLIVDLQDLKDFIYLVLPNYLSYKILLNDQVLAAEDIGPWQYLNLTSKIEITDVLNFQIEIFINKNSDYFQKNQSRFYKNYFILVLIAWLTDITILISYLLLKRKSNRKKERLALDVKELQSKNQALLKCLQVHQKLDQMAARLQSANKIQAITELEEALKILENSTIEYDKKGKVIILNNLGTIFDILRQHDKAIEYYTESYETTIKLYDNEYNSDTAFCLNNMATAHYNNGNKDDSLKLLIKNLEINKFIYKDFPHPYLASSYYNVGNIYTDEKNYQAAIPYLQQSLKIYKKIEDYKNLAVILHNLAFAYSYLEEYDKAIALQLRSLKINKVIDNDSNLIGIAMGYHNLASIHQNKKSYKSAIHFYKKALKIFFSILEDHCDSHDVAITYNNMGFTYCYLEKYTKSIHCHSQALEILLNLKQDNLGNPDIATTFNNLGVSYRGARYYEEALIFHTLALNVLIEFYQNQLHHPDISATYYSLAITYLHKGNYSKAQVYVKQAIETLSFGGNDKHLAKTKELDYQISLQLGNKAFINNDLLQAKIYYQQIDFEHGLIDLNSEEFIKFQIKQANIAYVNKLLKCTINCQKLLLKLDPELEYENYYHNLATMYTILDNHTKANTNFVNALTFSKKYSTLYVEYAQFLIDYSDIFTNKTEEISDYLYEAIALSDNGCLKFGKLEINSVCKVLRNIIKQNNCSIVIDSKIYSYYLLIKYPKYINKNDNIFDILLAFTKLSHHLNDELNFILLKDSKKFLEEMNTKFLDSNYVEYNNISINIHDHLSSSDQELLGLIDYT